MCFTYACNFSSGNVIFPIKVLSDSLNFQPISICTWAYNLNMFESEIQPAPTKRKKKNNYCPMFCSSTAGTSSPHYPSQNHFMHPDLYPLLNCQCSISN